MFKEAYKDTLSLREFSASLDALIVSWHEYQTEIIEKGLHYKHYSKGYVTVHGNSCQIKEEPFALSEDQELKKLVHDLNFHNQDSAKDYVDYEATGFNILHRFKEENLPPERKENDISQFTKKSRLRLLKKLNRVDFDSAKDPYFITLTYPGRYPTDSKTYKRDLDVFLKRMKREFGNLAYLWRLEAQKRGAPHYHLIVYFDKDFKKEYLKRWVSQNWFEVVQRSWEIKDERHLKAGTNVKTVNGIRQAMWYVSKYMTKEQEDRLKDQGRYWGVSRNWGDLIIEHFELSPQQLIQFRRLLRIYLKDNPRMSKRVSRTPNIEVWGKYTFILNALKWVSLNYR